MHLGCVRVYVSISITHTLNPYVYLKLKVIFWLTYATLFILNKEMDWIALSFFGLDLVLNKEFGLRMVFNIRYLC